MPQEENYSIKQWAIDDRPREKLRLNGAETLSDAELIAILIHNGTHQKSAVDLARELLGKSKNSLRELGKLSVKDFMKIKGIGEAKAITVAAALELGRRRQAIIGSEKPVVTDSSSIARHLQAKYCDHQNEVFVVVFLNRANKINHIEEISSGGITGT